jgi:hypothetical protein
MAGGAHKPTSSLDWLGCATFRLTIGETVVFLDAYIDRVPNAPGPGFGADDVDRADWIRIMQSEGEPSAQLLPVSGGERVRLSDDVIITVLPSLPLASGFTLRCTSPTTRVSVMSD